MSAKYNGKRFKHAVGQYLEELQSGLVKILFLNFMY